MRTKTPGKSRRVKLLKLADKTSNLRSLMASPPAGWSRQRLSDYVVWAHDVVRSPLEKGHAGGAAAERTGPESADRSVGDSV